jgi:flagellar basal body rod protein FlgG
MCVVLYYFRCHTLAEHVHTAKRYMDPISVLAAGGIRSRMESLDLLANNLANAATSGYKVDREFYSLFTSDAAEANELGYKTVLPSIEQHWTDFSQGVLQNTGNPLDLALSGAGFFAVNGPSGPLYTRNGAFQLSGSGTLITSDGYPVRARGGGTITADPSMPIEVTPDGDVQQKGSTIGSLDLVKFADPMALQKRGNNNFQVTDPTKTPSDATDIEVHQGQTESSNVNTPAAAVQLVGVLRQFDMLHRAITLAADMQKKGIDEVARIPS